VRGVWWRCKKRPLFSNRLLRFIYGASVSTKKNFLAETVALNLHIPASLLIPLLGGSWGWITIPLLGEAIGNNSPLGRG